MFQANNYRISIVELSTFQVDADDIFTEDERNELIDFISANPHAGAVIQGSGGIRKLRWAAKGQGKRGGARVIYYFRDLNYPVFMLATYAKGEKLDISKRECAQMRDLVERLIAEYNTEASNILRIINKSA